MKVLLTLVLFVGTLAAQTLTLSGSPVRAGAPATVTLTIAGVGATPPAALQWSIPIPPTITGMTVTPAAASVTAGKSVSCNTVPSATINVVNCIAIAANNLVYASGPVATVTFTAPATPQTLTLSPTNVFGASLAGVNVAVTAAPPLSLTILPSPCDLNGDGKTDLDDLTLIVLVANSVGTCTAAQDLDGNGKCDVVDAQRVAVAASGGVCRVGP